MKSIFDPSFKYVPSTRTDVRKTFERVRREQLASRRGRAVDGDDAMNVVPLEPPRQGNSASVPGRVTR